MRELRPYLKLFWQHSGMLSLGLLLTLCFTGWIRIVVAFRLVLTVLQ